MKKHVILTLEYDMGDYSDMEEDGNKISTNPKDWGDSFCQADINLQDLDIVGVRIEEKG